MKSFLILVYFFLAGTLLFAQHYVPVDASSSVQFSIKNFGLNVDGSLKGLQGNISFDPGNLNASKFNVTVNSATVNTGNSSRDGHLKKEEYFNVVKYPTLDFVSTKITASGKAGEYAMDGTITIKGVSKSIAFPFVVSSVSNGNRFLGTFKINRRDFKIGGKSWVLSDDVSVILNVTTVKL